MPRSVTRLNWQRMEDVGTHTQLQSTTTAHDLELFDSYYQQYHQAVYANIQKMVQHPETAEDILQEVFLTFWSNRVSIKKEQAAGWLFVVSYNKAASFLKKKLKEPTLFIQEEILADTIHPEEQVDEQLYQLKLSMVEEAIKHLPARKKEVFQLCRYEGRSADEVAALLGISTMSVKDYLKQSTHFIRQYIHQNYPTITAASLPLLLVYMSAN